MSHPVNPISLATASTRRIVRALNRRHHRHKKSSSSKRYSLRREAQKKLWKEAFHDKELAEFVSQDFYPIIGVVRGEVILDSRGMVSPALKE